MPAAGWYFMFILTAWVPNHYAAYVGPFPTQAVCEAAWKGADEFLAPGAHPQLCTDDPFVMDAQWIEAIEKERREAEYGGGT